MERFWVYLENRVQGPVEIPALRKLPGFNLLTQVCFEGQESWRLADDVIEIKAYFSTPPRGSSLIEESRRPELPGFDRSQIEIPLSTSGLDRIAAMPMAARIQGEGIETLDPSPIVVGNVLKQPVPVPASGALRQSCVTCGYKNPRDVNVCMKCGTPIAAAAPAPGEKPPISLHALAELPGPPEKSALVLKPEEEMVKAKQPGEAHAGSPMVEIPLARILTILACVCLAGAIFFAVRHMWKRKHHAPAPAPVGIQGKTAAAPAKAKRRAGARQAHRLTAKLPGVSSENEEAPLKSTAHGQAGEGSSVEEGAPSGRKARRPVDSEASAPETTDPSREGTAASRPASYTVLDQAYPLQRRTSAPVDSKYAVKRRGDRGLWASKEDPAIQHVLGHRIYGGQRTIGRNTEILMQVLRDREYSTAFESGKRLYLFNDVDWSASQKTGTMYDVRLVFSGGKEADGSPRAPLRFAFNVDLERRTVEPGGTSAIRSNTMHAFFDESRIPPEERRSAAKDTEELVQAAQPGASPLALDTISKHYAATYSYPALSRIADTYKLTIVNKKLAHETSLVADVFGDGKGAAKTAKAAAPEKKAKAFSSMSGSIHYTMERGSGKERLFTAKAPSRASPAKLWETFTAYDRLTQIVPDILVSQREGQDGPAVIVHTVSLTRLMFFVFKINLHLRIVEHPQQRRLEFERIAGDFEKFSGYVEMVPHTEGTQSSMNLHVAISPKGRLPNWVMRDMAKHFLVPVLDAVRAKAEAN